ncbi:MAG: DUF2130 domain-containing protein [Planctomycetaceae bacterium]|nr:MAG: DUF2130 domain-containing protein [Planctomycetaceae bacterium]
MSSNIVCPNCKIQIEITEVMSAQLRASIRNELEAELNTTRQCLKQQQDELAQRQREVQQKAEAVDEQVRVKLDQERRQLEQSLRKKLGDERAELIRQTQERAREELGIQLKDRDAELSKLRAKSEQADRNELTFLKEKRDLEEKLRNADLEVERKLRQELEKIRQAALKELDEQYRLKLLENEQKVEGLLRQIDEMKRKAEQGSQQAQGEVMEVALEQLLKELFPTDSIEPVPKGVHGADVIQHVLDESGTDCGLILWESKRTRHWSPQWLPKLRDDLRTVGASRSVIVSEQLPDHVRHFGQVDGVWVVSWACIHPVAIALREGLVAVAKNRRALEGQHGKMELVYDYLIGQEFYNRVSGIVEAFITMRQDLEAERRVLIARWKKREKQLDRVLFSTSGLYGDLQGIIGRSLPEIKGMSLIDLGTEALPEGKNGQALPDSEESDD